LIRWYDIDFDADIDSYIPESVDLTGFNKFKEDAKNDDIEDVDNDSEYVSEPKPKKCHVFKENIPRWKWEKTCRYWIKQDDSGLYSRMEDYLS